MKLLFFKYGGSHVTNDLHIELNEKFTGENFFIYLFPFQVTDHQTKEHSENGPSCMLLSISITVSKSLNLT